MQRQDPILWVARALALVVLVFVLIVLLNLYRSATQGPIAAPGPPAAAWTCAESTETAAAHRARRLACGEPPSG